MHSSDRSRPGSAEPLVSVVLPAYDREPYLREAIQSVLSQTYSNWELIVVDDGSPDETRSYLRALAEDRVRVIERDHCGSPAAVRNVGIAAARGAYVAFLDSDDVWAPEKLATQLGQLRARPNCRWSYTFVKQIDGGGKEVPLPLASRFQRVPTAQPILKDLITFGALVATPAVLVERDLLAGIGGFDESFAFCEDYELWTRLATSGEVVVVPLPLTSVRSHGASYAAGRPEVPHYWVRLYEKVMASTTDTVIRRLCREQRAYNLIKIANHHRGAGQIRAALGALIRGGDCGLGVPAWWVALLKTCLRPALPPPARRVYRAIRYRERGP